MHARGRAAFHDVRSPPVYARLTRVTGRAMKPAPREPGVVFPRYQPVESARLRVDSGCRAAVRVRGRDPFAWCRPQMSGIVRTIPTLVLRSDLDVPDQVGSQAGRQT